MLAIHESLSEKSKIFRVHSIKGDTVPIAFCQLSSVNRRRCITSNACISDAVLQSFNCRRSFFWRNSFCQSMLWRIFEIWRPFETVVQFKTWKYLRISWKTMQRNCSSLDNKYQVSYNVQNVSSPLRWYTCCFSCQLGLFYGWINR